MANTRVKDLERAEMLLEQTKPNVELDVFDAPTVEALKEAMELFEKWEVEEKMAEVYLSWGHYQFYDEDFQKASDFFHKSLAISKSLYGEVNEMAAEAYIGLTNHGIETHQLELAKEHINKALEINLHLFGEKHLGTVKSYFLLGQVINSQENGNDIRYAEKALSIAHELPNCPLILFGHIYVDTAIIFFFMYDYTQAKDYLEKALGIYQKLLPVTHRSFGNVYYHLGLILKREANYKKALLYLQKAENTFLANNPNSFYLAFIFHETGNVYSKLSAYSKSIKKAEEALAVLDQSGI
ncbi:MAG: tetratricopeptide repeat protein, partial [Chitinophagales bacterium]